MSNKLFDISSYDELEDYMENLNQSFDIENISLDEELKKSTKSRKISE